MDYSFTLRIIIAIVEKAFKLLIITRKRLFQVKFEQFKFIDLSQYNLNGYASSQKTI